MKFLKKAILTTIAVGMFVPAVFAASSFDYDAVITPVVVGNPTQLASATSTEGDYSKDQRRLQKRVLAILDKTYGSANTFANYGVMYWDCGYLHVGIKDSKQEKEVAKNIAAAQTKENPMTVVVESATYSQNDYFELQNEAINDFVNLEGPNKVVTTLSDAVNHKLLLLVTDAKESTIKTIEKEFDGAVEVLVQEPEITPAPTPTEVATVSTTKAAPAK